MKNHSFPEEKGFRVTPNHGGEGFVVLLENSWCYDINAKTGSMKEGTVPVPPYRPCAFWDSDELPFRVLSHRGSHRDGGEIPSERIAGN